MRPVVSAPRLGIVTPAVQATDTTPAVPAVMGPMLHVPYVDGAGVHRTVEIPAPIVATFTSNADLQAWCAANLDPPVPSWIVQPGASGTKTPGGLILVAPIIAPRVGAIDKAAGTTGPALEFAYRTPSGTEQQCTVPAAGVAACSSMDDLLVWCDAHIGQATALPSWVVQPS